MWKAFASKLPPVTLRGCAFHWGLSVPGKFDVVLLHTSLPLI